MTLTLHQVTEANKGSPTLATDHPILYEVLGLPPGQEVFIRQMGHSWKVLKVRYGVRTAWSEGYESAEEALATVQTEFS